MVLQCKLPVYFHRSVFNSTLTVQTCVTLFVMIVAMTEAGLWNLKEWCLGSTSNTLSPLSRSFFVCHVSTRSVSWLGDVGSQSASPECQGGHATGWRLAWCSSGRQQISCPLVWSLCEYSDLGKEKQVHLYIHLQCQARSVSCTVLWTFR